MIRKNNSTWKTILQKNKKYANFHRDKKPYSDPSLINNKMAATLTQTWTKILPQIFNLVKSNYK
jgi:hypothetical protein